MDYSPFNPVVWVSFFGCIVLVYLSVKIYHLRYPNYPHKAEAVEASSTALGRYLQIFGPPPAGDKSSQIQE